MKFEYKVIGIIHAGMIKVWPVEKDGTFKGPTEQLNKLGNEGWELVGTFGAGNLDRGVYIFKRMKQ